MKRRLVTLAATLAVVAMLASPADARGNSVAVFTEADPDNPTFMTYRQAAKACGVSVGSLAQQNARGGQPSCVQQV